MSNVAERSCLVRSRRNSRRGLTWCRHVGAEVMLERGVQAPQVAHHPMKAPADLVALELRYGLSEGPQLGELWKVEPAADGERDGTRRLAD